MTSIYAFNGTPLLVFAIVALVVGSVLLVAPFLGLGAKRNDAALDSSMNQIDGCPGASARAREAYIADIVDAPAAPLALTR